jgi:endonuclease/exonuclease/phosphatase (EEP) superfamily protein YafD
VRARFDGRQWGLGEIEVVNTHVVNPIAPPLRESRRLRQRELASLEALLHEPAETRVLVGDFNSSPVWPLYRRLAAAATDGAVAAGTARRTWGYWPKSPPMLRIDHVFVQGAKCVRTDVVKVSGADHRGLLMEIEPLRDDHQP